MARLLAFSVTGGPPTNRSVSLSEASRFWLRLGLISFGAMAVTIAALTFLYGLTSTLLTHFLAERIRANPRISTTLEKLAGTFLIAFGIKLAISR